MTLAAKLLLVLAIVFSPFVSRIALAEKGTNESCIAQSLINPAQQGYSLYNEQHFRDAAVCFELALKDDPGNLALLMQLAYAYRKSGQNQKASGRFEQAWSKAPPEKKPYLGREIEALGRPLRLSGYLVHRQNSIARDGLAAAGGTLTQSQAGIEVDYRPPGIGFKDGRTLDIFSRLLWGLDGNTLHFRNETYQAGIGIKYKPFSTANFILAGERLIPIGRESRADWLLRTAYSWDKGYGIQEGQESWFYFTAYADLAVIRPADPDLFAASDIRAGYSFRITKGTGPALVLTPHIVATAVAQRDHIRTTTLLEWGPGIDFKFWFRNGAHGSFRSSIDIIFQYRLRIVGNSAGKSGMMLTAVIDF